MAKIRNKIKWEQARPLKRPDNIQSSEYATTTQFIPSYEKKPEHNMKFLLGMEYSRKWHEEREQYHKHLVPPVEVSYFPRKYVIRGLRKKLQSKLPTTMSPFKMKKFMNVPAKTDNKREPLRKGPDPNSLPNNKIDISNQKMNNQNKSTDKNETESLTPTNRSSKQLCECCYENKRQYEVTPQERARYADDISDKPDKCDKSTPNDSDNSADSEDQYKTSIQNNQHRTDKCEINDETTSNYHADTDKVNEKMCSWLKEKGTPCNKPCLSSKSKQSVRSSQSDLSTRSTASSKACPLQGNLPDSFNKPLQEGSLSRRSTDNRISCGRNVITYPKIAGCGRREGIKV